MAFWSKKKSSEDGQPPEEGEAAIDIGFVPDPANALKWFDHARKAANSKNFEGALAYFANGIKLDPEEMAAHDEMYQAGVAYCAGGGKGASGKEIKSIDGPDAVHKFAAAEFAWMKEISNPSLAVKFVEAAVKSSQHAVARLHAPRVLNLLIKQKRISKSQLKSTMELFAQASAWNEAMSAGEAAQRLDPSDNDLAQYLKDLMAQRAMDQAGYAEAAGKEGGFRGLIRDADKQRELQESESIVSSESAEERNLERARKDLEDNPANPDAINKYAQLLKKRGTKEAEDDAYEIYMKGFRLANEYRFRMAAGDIRIGQAQRRENEAAERLQANPSDTRVQSELQQAKQELQQLQLGEYAERVEKYPTDRRLKYVYGEALFEAGRYGDAMAQFQTAKDEPKVRLRSGYLLARCFAAEGWHAEAVQEYREALEKMDPSERELENDIRYDLMESLLSLAREESSVEHAREALQICSDIARKDITFRDIRARRNEIGALIKELGG